MYKKLIETEDAEINKTKVDFIKKYKVSYIEPLIKCRKIIHLRLKRKKR